MIARGGDDAIENKEERLQDMEAVKEYLSLLEQDDGMKYMALPFLNIFRDMDLLKGKLGMASEEMESVQEKATALPDGKGKEYVLHALYVAAEGIGTAKGYFSLAESSVVKGVEKSIAEFRNGNGSSLRKPFPILKVEKELERIMEKLKGSFAFVDRGIEKMEDAEGVRCEDGHYKDAENRNLWNEGEENCALLEVLWPLRTLEDLIGQAYDMAHNVACRVDGMREKARRVIKRDILVPGVYWEKKRAALEVKQQEEPPIGEKCKPSLRQRLEEMKVADASPNCMHESHECGKKRRDSNMQR